MPSLRQLNTRIKSVQTTSKLTKAMQAVAAMRLRKYSQKADFIKKYGISLNNILGEIIQGLDFSEIGTLLQDFKIRESGAVLVVLISPSRGFCGGLHRSVVTETYKYLQSLGLDPFNAEQVNFLTVNKSAQRLVTKLGGQILAYFNGPFKEVDAYSLLPISELVSQIWSQGKIKEVLVAYAQANSALKADIQFETILPLKVNEVFAETEKEPENFTPTEIEISPSELLAEFLPQWLEMNIQKALLLTQTAEEGARMMAMNQATDNAKRLTDKLKLSYFRQRQAKITQEISEIVSGSL